MNPRRWITAGAALTIALSWAGCAEKQAGVTEKPTASKAALEEAPENGRADQAPEEWERYVERRKAAYQAAAPIEAAALKAQPTTATLMRQALSRAVEVQTAHKTLSIAAPNEWAVYQAAEEALKRTAPEEWEAWETTARKWDTILPEALFEEPTPPVLAQQRKPPVRKPPVVEANALEKRWAHEATEAALADAPEEWKAYKAAEAALADAAPEEWKRYVDDAKAIYSAKFRKATTASEKAVLMARHQRIMLWWRTELAKTAPNEWAVYQAAEEALQRAVPEAWKAWEAHRAALW